MTARREYLRHLAGLRRRVRDTAVKQRDGLFYRHPDPDRLWSTVGSHRLWERRPNDADFGVVRIGGRPAGAGHPARAAGDPAAGGPGADDGRGAAPVPRRVLGGAGPAGRALAARLRPGVRPGRARRRVGAGPGDARPARDVPRARRPAGRGLRRAGAPGRVGVGQVAAARAAPRPDRRARPGAAGRAAGPPSWRLLDDVLANRPRFNPDRPGARTGPHVVVVLDGGDLAGATQLARRRHRRRHHRRPRRPAAAAARPVDAGARAGGRTAQLDTLHDGRRRHRSGTPTRSPPPRPRRWPAGWRRCGSPTTGKGSDAPLAAELGLAELLGLGDPTRSTVDAGLGAARQPRPAAGADRRRAPTAAPVELDLKESAQDGMGPHGLLIGATGSGKSELLRTLVLALAATHSSEMLNFVLVDFKGGATFADAGPAAAHQRGDHQPGRRAAAGRPHGRRDQRRADPPAGAAAPGRQLRLAARLRAGPGGRRRRWRRCPRC